MIVIHPGNEVGVADIVELWKFFTLSHLLINHKINKSRGMFLVCSTIFTNHTRFILGTSNIVVDIVESHFSLIDSVWLSSLQSHSSPRFNLDDLLYDHFSQLTLCFSPWSLWSSSFLPHLTRGSQKQPQLLTVFDSPVSLHSFWFRWSLSPITFDKTAFFTSLSHSHHHHLNSFESNFQIFTCISSSATLADSVWLSSLTHSSPRFNLDLALIAAIQHEGAAHTWRFSQI